MATKDRKSALGLPLIPNIIGRVVLQKVIKVADVRLGHTRTSITLDVYSHSLMGQQAESAQRLGNLLHG